MTDAGGSTLTTITPGTRIGEYRVTRVGVGRGQTGAVHAGVDREGRPVALKVLAAGSTEAERARLAAEFAKLARWRHPYLVTARDLITHGDALVLVTDWVEGVPFATWCRGQTTETILALGVQLFEALAFLHQQQWLHLDIKSENVLVRTTDEGPQLTLLDFGLARPRADYAGTLAGSLPYTAPEVVFGRSDDVDGRADCYSAAVLLYRALTWGRWPFPLRVRETKETIRTIVTAETRPKPPSYARSRGIPAWVDELLVGLLAADPTDRRPATAAGVVALLRARGLAPSAPAVALAAPYLRPPADVLIGRTQARATLEAAVTQLAAGVQPRPSVVVIHGASGTGRTHYLQWLAQRVADPAHGIACERLALPAADESLTAWLSQVEGHFVEGRPTLLLIDDVDCEFPSPLVGEGQGEGVGRNGVFVSLLHTIQRRSTDAATAATLPPIVAILTTTTPEIGEPSLIGRLTTLGLDPTTVLLLDLPAFTRDELAAYCRATPALAEREVPAVWLDELHTVTAGIPAEAAAVLEELDSRDLLFDPMGEMAVASLEQPDYERSRLPVPTQERLLQRYAALPAATQDVLAALAAWSHFDPTVACPLDVLARVTDGAANVLREELTASRLVEVHSIAGTVPSGDSPPGPSPHGPAVTWSPSLAAAIVFAALPSRTQQQWHARWAAWAVSNVSCAPLHHAATALHARAWFHHALGTSPTCSPSSLKRGSGGVTGSCGCINEGRNSPQPPLILRGGSAAALLRVAQWALRRGEVLLTKRCTSLALTSYNDDDAMSDPPNNLRACAVLLHSEARYHDEPTETVRGEVRDVLARDGVARSWRVQLLFRQLRLEIDREDYALARATADLVASQLRPTDRVFSLRLDYYRQEIEQRDPVTTEVVATDTPERYRNLAERWAALPSTNRTRVRNREEGTWWRSRSEFATAMPLLDQLLQDHATEHDYFGQLRVGLMLADLARREGRLDVALANAERVLAVVRPAAQETWAVTAQQILAGIHYDADRFEAAIATARRALVTLACMPTGPLRDELQAYLFLITGNCYRDLGQPSSARTYFTALAGAVSVPEALRQEAVTALATLG